MVICQYCGRAIPNDSLFCSYCGRQRTLLITNYGLPKDMSREVYLTSGSIATYSTLGNMSVASSRIHPESPFLDFGAKDFKSQWKAIPDEFPKKISEGEESVKKYNLEIQRRNRAATITFLIGNTNVAFQAKKNAKLFREDDSRIVVDFHAPCQNEADFISKIARLASLFEVKLNSLKKLVNNPEDLKSIKLVERWLQENRIAFDPNMINTWMNIVALRNMKPLHANLKPEELERILNFFGTTSPPDYQKLWDSILDKFLQSLNAWQEILAKLRTNPRKL